MAKDFRTIRIGPRSARVLHIEAPGCIVNIRHGLRNTAGREIISVTVLCDQDWFLPDFNGSTSANVRAQKGENHGKA